MKTAPMLLKGAVIYGANSGGKSNLVRAMSFLQLFVANSARSGQIGDVLDVDAYRLDPALLDEPSQFEIIFIVDRTTYQYGFAVDQQKIHHEWLYETAFEGRLRHIFSRDIRSDGNYDWYVNSRVRGERKLWQESTRPNALFLSVAVQLNSVEFQEPFEWLSGKFRVLLGQEQISQSVTSSICHAAEGKTSVLDILRSVDPGVCDVITTEEDFRESDLPEDLPNEVRTEVIKNMKGRKLYQAEIARRSINGDLVSFDMEDESTGTNILYNLAGPWLETLKRGYTLVIDELDSGLHPLALKALVSMFFDSSKNTSNAQLIITCHEATLLRENMLRSDQVWFIDKTPEAGSRLYPLSEFKPKQNESFLRGYLGGRYGGIPVTRSYHDA
ncbi:ATP-binding protein [Sphingosinicellaceae bacterium]|nr:ATP-binding protein [Sphingosinicellaceae bacterium]